MPESRTIQPYPIELCRVLTAEQVRVDGATVVRCTLDIDAPDPVRTITVPDGSVAVLRYVGSNDYQEEGGRLEVVGDAQNLPDSCFAQRGRRGGLRVINPARAYTEATYLGDELHKLHRLLHPDSSISTPLPARTERVRNLKDMQRLRRERAYRASRISTELITRQIALMVRICNLAASDELRGVYDPDTARARALGGMVVEA